MKTLLCFILLSFFTILKGFGCECFPEKPAIEFYSSQYVFQGTITSKVYAQDSLTYTVTFDIEKHYKKGDSPNKLDFTLVSESKYTGYWTSCDWHANVNQTWLVYTSSWGGKLSFSGICSNSKVLNSREIDKNEQIVLNNGNKLNLDDYIFDYERGFTTPRPITSIDSIITKYDSYENENNYIVIALDIDKRGRLIKANLAPTEKPEIEVIDSIFNLNKFKNKEYRKPKSTYEKDVLEIARQIKSWKPKVFIKTEEPVKARVFLKFFIDKDNRITVTTQQ
jgi:hypothetical protein